MIDDYWWLLMLIDDYWWLLMIIDDYWWLLMIIDDYWLKTRYWWWLTNLQKYIVTSWLLTIHGYWRLLMIDNSPLLIVVSWPGMTMSPWWFSFFFYVWWTRLDGKFSLIFFNENHWYNCSSNMVWHPTGRFIQPIPGGWPAQVSGLLVEDSTGHWTGSHDGTFFWGEIATYEIPSGYD